MKNYILLAMDMESFEESVFRYSSPNRHELEKMAEFLTLETHGKVLYYISEVEVYDTASDMIEKYKELRKADNYENGIYN